MEGCEGSSQPRRGEEHRLCCWQAWRSNTPHTLLLHRPVAGGHLPAPVPSARLEVARTAAGNDRPQGAGGRPGARGQGAEEKQERITAHVKYSGAKQVFFPYFCFCCAVFVLLSQEDPDYPVRKVCVVFLLLQPIWSVCAGLSSGRCKALAFPKQERGVGISAALPISYRASEA